MKRFARWFLVVVAAAFASAALAQHPEPRPRAIFERPELDQMLAPIALYPDSLLSQILIAASYPRDVFEAASWARYNRSLRGEDAVRAVENRPWDPSVISLVAFPEVLEMMDERREWTERLGMAFLDQGDDVMGTIQDLRRRADEAGNLRSSEEMRVYREGEDFLIEPPSPEVVYVPYYDPHVVYGAWWWPDYSPVYWRPWAGYRWHAGYGGFGWGYGTRLGPSFFFGAFDWRHRYVRYTSHRPWYHRHGDWRGGNRWTHRGDSRRTADRWRDGDRRWGDRIGDRRIPGTQDRREWRDGDGRRRTVTTTQSPATSQGFFRAPLPQNAVAPGTGVDQPRTAPRYSTDGARIERRAPVQTGREALRQEPTRQEPTRQEQQSNRIARPAFQPRVAPAGTVAQSAPQVQRVAPAPQPAPVQQAAPERNPVERSSPRAAPAREQRESRERDPSSDSTPSRGNGFSRGRDR